MSLALTLGDLKAAGFLIHRSGIRWLCEPGHLCQANEVIGYCNIRLAHSHVSQRATSPLTRESEVQIAFAPRVAGTLTLDAGASRGGYLDVLGAQAWDPSTIIAAGATEFYVSRQRLGGR